MAYISDRTGAEIKPYFSPPAWPKKAIDNLFVNCIWNELNPNKTLGKSIEGLSVVCTRHLYNSLSDWKEKVCPVGLPKITSSGYLIIQS